MATELVVTRELKKPLILIVILFLNGCHRFKPMKNQAGAGRSRPVKAGQTCDVSHNC